MAQHLSTERTREIYDAVFALVAEHGYANVRIDQIAKAAHTSTATIYRHWGSKSKLVVGVLTADKPDGHRHINTGSLLGDLHAQIDPVGHEMAMAVRFLTSIALASNHDAELADSYREHGVPVIRHALDDAVARAVARGEVSADHPAMPHLVPMLLAPYVVSGQLFLGSTTPDHMHEYIDSVIAPLLGLATTSKDD